MQKSFKGAWGQISPTSEKWLQATLLAKCEAGRVRRLASSKVGTALHCLPVLSRIRIILEQSPFSLFRMMEAAGTTEELKARNPMRWVGLMNTLKAQVEEVLLQELVYI